MAMTTEPGAPSRLMFASMLVLSWVLVSAGVAAAIYADRDPSPVRLGSWVSLWVFSILVPTLNAVTLRRLGHGLARDGDSHRPQELIRLGMLLLLSANMALLSALALIVRP